MEEKEILIEEEGGILRINLNRPKVRNALTTSMMEEITSLIEARDQSPEPRGVIFSGKGSSFCSGSDFHQLQRDQGMEKIHQHLRAIAQMLKALRNTPKFLIAEVHGNALGGGMGLAMACDWIIASTNARFGLPEMKLGFIPALALVPLAHRVHERALEIMMTGEVLEKPLRPWPWASSRRCCRRTKSLRGLASWPGCLFREIPNLQGWPSRFTAPFSPWTMNEGLIMRPN